MKLLKFKEDKFLEKPPGKNCSAMLKKENIESQ
jgi:hypothetical protein